MFHNVRSNIKPYLVEDPVQNIASDYCGVFQLYFYVHLIGPNNDSKISDHETLSKNTVKTLLNELFLPDQCHEGNV